MQVLIAKETIISRKKEKPGENQNKILFIDNYEHFFEPAVRHLTDNGLELIAKRIETFDSFERELTHFYPSIIVSSFSLNNFNAIDLLNFLSKSGIEIPLIVIDDSVIIDHIIESLKSGAYSYLTKDDFPTLTSTIKNAIKENQNKLAVSNRDKKINYRELSENLLHILNKSGLGFAILNGQNKQIEFITDSFCSICGYNINDIFLLPSFLNLVERESISIFNSQIQIILGNKNEVRVFNLEIITKDKNRVKLEIAARQMSLEPDGENPDNKIGKNKKRIMLVVEDQTKRTNIELMQKLTSDALIESEKRFRSFIEGVKDYAIFMLDMEGRITSWNAGSERITGYNEPEIILKNFNIFSKEAEQPESEIDNMLTDAKSEGRAEREIWMKKKDDQSFWADVSINSYFDENNNLINFSVIIRDLTKIKNTEDQLRENEKQLRALAAHLQAAREEERTRIARELHDEFSQMLTAVRLDLTILNRMISKSALEPLSRLSLLEKIASISDLLESTIKSIRKVITQLRPSVLDELGLLTAIQWQAQEFETRTNIRCRISRIQHNIKLDQEKSTAIFRIYQEALTNVAKHSAATSVTASLPVIESELVLEIADNGKGIGKSKVKDPTSTGIMGIRERVIALGGRFEIESEIDKGTKLIVAIPYNNS